MVREASLALVVVDRMSSKTSWDRVGFAEFAVSLESFLALDTSIVVAVLAVVHL